jgi:hypothetical protein
LTIVDFPDSPELEREGIEGVSMYDFTKEMFEKMVGASSTPGPDQGG